MPRVFVAANPEMLRQLKESSGLSLREISRRVAARGISFNRTKFPAILNGQTTSLERAEALADVFGVPVQAIFTHANGDPIGGGHE